jgi:putative acetyltransferase
MIRRATLADAAAILRVHMASIAALARSHYSARQIDVWCGRRSPESYHEPIGSKVVFVAEEFGSLIGFGQLNANSGCVEAVYVLPESVHLGVGGRLLAALEAQARALGLAELSLDASLNSVAFYAQAGYSPVREANHELEPGTFIPCIVMCKSLRPNAA